MTGIAGLLSLNGQESSKENVGALLQGMSHRGTIQELIAPAATLALGICSNQSITRSLHAAQQSVILLDGAIHGGLPESLQNCNERSKPSTSNEARTLLEAFREGRHRILDDLVGDFAFAIWDHDRQELTLARDAFGTRPIFFYKDRKRIVFASEVKGLLNLPWISTGLNRERVADYLLGSLEGINKHATFHENIYRVPAGSYLTICNRSVATHPYWKPSTDVTEHLDDTDSIATFASTFRTAVECRYQAPAQTGILLSGGIDSCSIVGSARDMVSSPVNTFSLISGAHDPDCDESHSVALMQSMGHLNARNLSPDEVSKVAPTIPSFVARIDNPFTASLLAGPVPLYAMAQAEGLEAVLDGVDGDVVTSLTGNHHWFLANEFGIKTGLRELVNEAAYYESNAELPKAITRFLFRRLANGLISRSNPIRSLFRRRQGSRTGQNDITNSPIKNSFAKETHVLDRFRQQHENEHPNYPDTIRKACQQTLTAPYIVAAIERYEEAAASFGLTASHPFMDRRLVEFCLRIPWNFRIHHGQPKWILRQAMKPVLPKEIYAQYKIANIGHWFIHEILRDYLRQNPAPSSRTLETLEDFVEIDELKQRWRTAGENPEEANDDLLSSSIILSEWLQQHF